MVRKVKAKNKHLSYHSYDQAMPNKTNPPSVITDGVLPPCKRANGRAKVAISWKRAHALENWSDSREEKVSDIPDYASYDEPRKF
ncbi:Hypothetical predicted protein [Pelobates cultripes]|uniref:Uncharacterized protein n=1 Tax=Pelobates cultripes TaxID=61616 RepID=A0AAD1W4I5_PELCU|nr:Hypothetical predicted protein [Pelobates cultripes]